MLSNEDYYNLVTDTYLSLLKFNHYSPETIKQRLIGMIDGLFYLSLIDDKMRKFFIKSSINIIKGDKK